MKFLIDRCAGVRLADLLARHARELETHAIVTVRAGRVRIAYRPAKG